MKRRAQLVSCVSVGVFLAAFPAAAQVLDVSGNVVLLDGSALGDVDVDLSVDLDRDGQINGFETLRGSVNSNGSYNLDYTPSLDNVDLEFIVYVTQLLASYDTLGFEALLEDGPLPVTVRFSKEGYSTVVKRFTTLNDAPSLDVMLAPLRPVACDGAVCQSPDGRVSVSGFPGGTGIDRAFARGYDPENDTAFFPGSFTDDDQNLLISSGFTEIDLRDENGNPVTQLSSPVSVRMEANRTSWASLRDIDPGSGSVEVPMYSFNEQIAEWVSEPDGELQDTDGTPVDEADFPDILDGSREEPVFIAFDTSHFSTFNCDKPVEARACVKGRLMFEGRALARAEVSVDGVSYTGNAGVMFTGDDGTFAADVMKSENADEDVDYSGTQGERFDAQVVVTGSAGLYLGAAFSTPNVQSTVGACRAPDCDCEDLGDIEVEFEAPRACTVNVTVRYSGESNIGEEGTVDAGAGVSARVTGQLQGRGVVAPQVCGSSACGSATTEADGSASFIVPVLGDAPTVHVEADYSYEDGGQTHFYSGSLDVTGCADGEASVDAEIALSHVQLSGLAAFIVGLGSGPSVGTATGTVTGSNPIDDFFNPSSNDDDDDAKSPFGCDCRTAPSPSPGVPLGGLGLGLFALAALVRRRHPSSRRPSRPTTPTRWALGKTPSDGASGLGYPRKKMGDELRRVELLAPTPGRAVQRPRFVPEVVRLGLEASSGIFVSSPIRRANPRWLAVS